MMLSRSTAWAIAFRHRTSLEPFQLQGIDHTACRPNLFRHSIEPEHVLVHSRPEIRDLEFPFQCIAFEDGNVRGLSVSSMSRLPV